MSADGHCSAPLPLGESLGTTVGEHVMATIDATIEHAHAALEQHVSSPRAGRTFGRRTAFFMVRQSQLEPKPASRITLDRKRGIATIHFGGP